MRYIKKENNKFVVYEAFYGPMSAETVRIISRHRSKKAALKKVGE